MLIEQARLLRDIAKSARQDTEIHDLLYKLARECEDLAHARAPSPEPGDSRAASERGSAASPKPG